MTLNIHYAGKVTLNNVEIINGTATAITNNGSEVTATELTTSDNAWGAVNVDKSGTFNLVSGTLNEPSQIWSEDADDNDGSKITVPGGWTKVKVNKLDGEKEDVKTHYTTDIKKLGEAYNEDTETVYDTVGHALSAAKSGETVQVINTRVRRGVRGRCGRAARARRARPRRVGRRAEPRPLHAGAAARMSP